MSVYKSKAFTRFQKKAKLTDRDLWKACAGRRKWLDRRQSWRRVIKQRIAQAGKGKSGGSRSIILFRQGSRAVFVYGFDKKDRANIKADEMEAFKELATVILGYTHAELSKRVEDGALLAVETPNEEACDG